uniref:Uncharacterized protein n=1 Tax=Rhizophora mucronata TaxID=61149 RepID=A0A2P2KKP0_RHIMU
MPSSSSVQLLTLAFSFESSSVASVEVEFRAVNFPKDSFASPKKSFTLSSTVLSWSCVGSSITSVVEMAALRLPFSCIFDISFQAMKWKHPLLLFLPKYEVFIM